MSSRRKTKPKKRAIGRRPKLEVEPRITKTLCKLIAQGVPIKHACSMAGIGESTFHRWCDEGAKENASDELREFRESITRARVEKITKLLETIEKASTLASYTSGLLDWKAAAWLLERTEPEFRPNQKTELTGKDGGPVQVDSSVSELLARARKARAEREGK